MTKPFKSLIGRAFLIVPILLAVLWHLYSVGAGGPAYSAEMYITTLLVAIAAVSLAIGMHEWEQGRVSSAAMVAHLMSPLGWLLLAWSVWLPADHPWRLRISVLGAACVILAGSLRARAERVMGEPR